MGHVRWRLFRHVCVTRNEQPRRFLVNNDGHLIVVREAGENERWLIRLYGAHVKGCLVSIALARNRAYKGKGKITKKWFHVDLSCPITGESCEDHECLKLVLSGKVKNGEHGKCGKKIKLCAEKAGVNWE